MKTITRMKIVGGCAVLILWMLILSADPSLGVTVKVQPESQNAALGGSLTVNIVASGLGDFVAPALGAFDLNLAFDPAILDFANINFGPFLGDEAQGEAISGLATLSSDLMAFEVSSLLPAELIALQPSSLPLFTVTFNVIAEGTSALDLSLNALSDELGTPLIADLVDGSVTAAPAIFIDGFESGDLNMWSSSVGGP